MERTEGAFSILQNNDNKIMLVKRRDVSFWDLPGGRRDSNETIEDCAVREFREETGYIVEIESKVGEYIRPLYDDAQHIFSVRIVGGQPIESGDETVALDWFLSDSLPRFLIPNRRMQIKDFISGSVGEVKTIEESVLKVIVMRLLQRVLYKIKKVS